jgi:radical SAM protein with 4Fe4S-binding SPASM domain
MVIDKSAIQDLKKLSKVRIQVSIDGMPETHDQIRGTGAFKEAEIAIHRLREANIPVTIAATIGRWNLAEVSELIAMAKTLGARSFAVHRFIPTGRGEEHNELQMLTGQETLDLYTLLLQENSVCREDFRVITENCSICSIASLLPNTVDTSDKIVGGCHIGTSCIHVHFDYNMITCPKANMVVADLRDVSLIDAFFDSLLLSKFRGRDFGIHCKSCPLRNRCGGCRAIALYLSGDIFGDESICPLISFDAKG